jgi:hypothetical protein
MTRAAGLLLAILLLSLPAFAPAMGLFGTGATSFSSVLGGPYGSMSYDSGGPLYCPQFYVGYNIAQGTDRNPTVFDATSRQFAFFVPGFNQFTINIREPSGVWLGVSNYCKVGPKLGFLASGWYLFPTTGEALQTFTFGGFFPPQVGSWTANKSMGWIDGAVILGSQCGLNLITGFRWDKYNLQLKNNVSISLGFPPGTNLPDEANLTMNHYMPFLGTQYCCGDPCSGLLVRVIGFPWAPGDGAFGQTSNNSADRFLATWTPDRAWFIEVFSEYSRKCDGFGCIGVFARFNYLSSKGTATPSFLPTVPSAFLPDYDFRLTRQSWTIGGKVELNFSVSFLPNFGLYL